MVNALRAIEDDRVCPCVPVRLDDVDGLLEDDEDEELEEEELEEEELEEEELEEEELEEDEELEELEELDGIGPLGRLGKFLMKLSASSSVGGNQFNSNKLSTSCVLFVQTDSPKFFATPWRNNFE